MPLGGSGVGGLQVANYVELVHGIVFGVISRHDLFKDLNRLELIAKRQCNVARMRHRHVLR